MLAMMCFTQMCRCLHLRQGTKGVLSGRVACLQHSIAYTIIPLLPQ